MKTLKNVWCKNDQMTSLIILGLVGITLGLVGGCSTSTTYTYIHKLQGQEWENENQRLEWLKYIKDKHDQKFGEWDSYGAPENLWAKYYRDKGQYDKAIKLHKEAMEEDTGSASKQDYSCDLRLTLVMKGDYLEGLEGQLKAIENNELYSCPDNLIAKLEKIVIEREGKQYLLDLYDKMAQKSDSPKERLFVRKAIIHKRAGNTKKVIENLARASAVRPGIAASLDEEIWGKAARSFDNRINFAAREWRQQVDKLEKNVVEKEGYQQMLKIYKELISIKGTEDHYKASLCERMGELNKRKGNYKQAVKNLSEAITYSPNYSRYFKKRAQIKMKMGKQKAAEKDLAKYRKLKRQRKQKLRRARQESNENEATQSGGNSSRSNSSGTTGGGDKENEQRKIKKWNKVTGNAPRRHYKGPVRGSTPPEWAHFGDEDTFLDSGAEVENDSTLQEAKRKLGTPESQRNIENDMKMVTWKFTWWYNSQPGVKFDYYFKTTFQKHENHGWRWNNVHTVKVYGRMPADDAPPQWIPNTTDFSWTGDSYPVKIK